MVLIPYASHLISSATTLYYLLHTIADFNGSKDGFDIIADKEVQSYKLIEIRSVRLD